MDEVIYDCRRTTETDEQFVKDWQFVENSVFENFTDELIKRKYFDNIYGPSIMAVAYLNGKPVGADALWRNDVNGKLAFQSSDTCVLEEARGHGIMTGITKHELAKAPEGCYIYGSPNGQSYHGYRKMGWNEVKLYKGILFSPKKYAKEYPEKMPYEYAKWWIKGTNKYHIKKRGHYYVVVKYATLPFWHAYVIAEVDKKTAELYPRYKGLSFFFYRSFKPIINIGPFKHYLYHIAWNADPKEFPYWKIDGWSE
jgi:hypothetical protein